MQYHFFNDDDYSSENRNQTISSFYLDELNEKDDNSYLSKYNNQTSSLQNNLNSPYDEIHRHSNENYIQKISEVEGNENLYKSINILEDSPPLIDIKKEIEKKRIGSTKEDSKENKGTNIVSIQEHSNNEEETKIGKSPIVQTIMIKPNMPSYWRFDAAKKHQKTKISQSFTDDLNIKIKNSDLSDEYKILIEKPTANVNNSAHCAFLEKDLRTILTIGKESNKNQKENDDNISKIYEYFEKIGYNNLSDKMKEIKNLFEMKYEDYIKKFYESEEFTNFKNEESTKFFDEGTKMQEGFTISEDLGFLKIFNRKRKRTQNS